MERKNILWRLSLTAVALLYGIAFAMFQGQVSASRDGLPKGRGTGGQRLRASLSSGLSCHTIQPDTHLWVSGQAPLRSGEEQAPGLAASAQAAENRYRALCTQYSFYARNVLARPAISDLIFPFHYFW